jgi:hypothetical protein
MKYRAVSAFATAIMAAGSLALGVVPASAANGPPSVGCTTGSSCMVELNWNVTYRGSRGGHNGVVVPPPPCIGVPVGDAYVGSQAILSLFGDTAPLPSDSPTPLAPTSPGDTPSDSPTPTDSATPTDGAGASPSPTATMTASTAALIVKADAGSDPQDQAIQDQARSLIATHPKPAGEWYQIAGNPSARASEQVKCKSLPPFIWQAGAAGTIHIAGFNIPPRTLAGLAYSQLTTAELGQVTLNPVAANDTNLPTFVDVAMTEPTRGFLSVTTEGVPYVWATAMTPDGTAATVWAWVTSMSITPGTTSATTFNDKRCATAHLDGDTYMLGSRYSAQAMASVGTGQQIDCGVTYTAPGTYNLTANVTWDACWAEGQLTPGGPPANCKPVPGAGGLAASTTQPFQVNVRDIQSVNG